MTVEVHAGADPVQGGSSMLQQFNADGAAAMSIAINLASTPFVPTSYKKRGERWLDKDEVAANVAAAWLAGQEIGLRPMQALQAIDIIEGRPALNALAQRALVQAHGHEIWVHERVSDARGQRTQVSVTVRGKRKGSDRVAESTWSLDRARQAGLLSKKNWQNHPEPMCFARASAEVCRQIAADVLMGLAYTVEELEDESAMVQGAGTHTVELKKEKAEPEGGVVELGGKEVEFSDDGQPTVEDIDKAGEQLVEQPKAVEAPKPDPKICPQVKPSDPSKACSRPVLHEGRHFFGRDIEPAPAPEPEPVADPETTAPELDPGVKDPEADEGFREPTEEELAQAYEREQAERAAQPSQQEPVAADKPVQPADEPIQGEPEDDDPWADFS